MKKIINGKKYDTDTAHKILEWENGCSYSDFGWIKETLYRKRTGEYFIHGEGGARTQYAEYSYGMYSDGENIIPISFEGAKEWLEEHGTADEYEDEFGEVEEDESKVVRTFSLTASSAERLQREASKRGVSQSAMVDEWAAGF